MPAGAQKRRAGPAEGGGRRNRAEREALQRAREVARERNAGAGRWRCSHAIGEMLPKDAVVIEEAVSSSGGLRQLVSSDDPQSFFGLRGGGIGWGLPAAIGVKIALPDRPVVGLIGDGSAMYTCQALWTAARYKIGVVFVILNNTLLPHPQAAPARACAAMRRRLDRYVGMELNDPAVDFVGLARSLGVAAERATTVHEATDLIAKALGGTSPMLIDVELAREFK